MKLAVATLLLLSAMAGYADDTLKFPIKAFRVVGNSLLPDTQIQTALQPYTGAERDFADVQRAQETLEGLYRQAGYGVLQVYLPEQELNQGVVELKVIEPALGQVRIEGNQYFGADNIRRALPALQEGKVPNTRALAQNLHLANEHPARRLAVTLQAGQAPQSVDANIQVADESPTRWFATADNSGSVETGRSRLVLGYQHGNLFDRDHALTAQFTTSPEKSDKVRIFGLGYKLPLYSLGDSLSLFAGYSNVESGALQGLFNVNGKGSIAGARYSQGLPDIGSYQHKLLWGLDWRRFDSSTRFAGGGQLPDTRYTLQPLSLGYQAQWQSTLWSYDWSASLSRNLPSGGDLAQVSGRSVAKDAYRILRLAGNVYYSPRPDWTTHLSVNSQFTADALAAGEQFGLGGSGSVRGYGERVLADDEGLNLNLEAYTPDMANWLGWQSISLRGTAFYDYGHLARNKALPGERTSENLAGAGLGLRLGWRKSASLKLDLAQALRDGGGEKKGDARVHVSATVSY